MLDMALLKRHGVSAGACKKIFSDDPANYSPKIKKLVNQTSLRIRDGIQLNLKEWRAYHAIDLAFNVPFSQTTPTLVLDILSKHLNAEETLRELENYGLKEDELFLKIKTDSGEEAMMLNPPVFFQIFIPLVKAYVTIRAAKIFNDLNTNPLFSYHPLHMADRDEVLCEIVTDMVDTTSTWYGYPAMVRQAILQTLKYGLVVGFPREEWHCEKQLRDGDRDPVTGATKEEAFVVKEGLRYILPDPTRMGFDLKHPLTSINTDSGCEFAFHWHVLSYGDILRNKQYWNRRNIFGGTNWFMSPNAGNYFSEVYPCSMKFPVSTFNTLNREDKSAWYSSSNSNDQQVFVSECFQKLIPKEWGLGDYDYPVWFRFTVAGDDTIIWAAPCAYNPIWFMGYDYDANAAYVSSMGLETIPWQDQLSNILSQMVSTAKQNLAKVVFYDNQIVDKGDIEKLQNLGEQRYRATQYIGFDSMKQKVQGLSTQKAFFPVNLGQSSIVELLQLIPQILNIMERVLQVTSQEAGSAASHQQSKAEVQQTSGASTNRVAFTKSFVDEGVDAIKRQQYAAHMAYRDPDLTAEVSSDVPDIEKIIADLGFVVKSKGRKTLLVTGKKGGLRLEGFARSNEGTDAAGDKEQAQAILQVVQTIVGQEDLHKEIGADALLSMVEYAAKLNGAGNDFKLRKAQKKDDQGEQVPPNILEAIKAAQTATLQAVEQKIGQPAAQEMAKVQSEIAQLQATAKKLEGIYQKAAAMEQQGAIQSKEADQKMAIRQKEFEAEQQRKDEKHRMEIRQDIQKAHIETAIDIQKAKAKTGIDAAQAEASAKAE